MKSLYFLLSVIGLVVPYYFFIDFLIANGPDFILLFNLLFSNNISIFFALDLLISCLVFIFYMIFEVRRLKMKNVQYLCIGSLLFFGLSFAFPLFMLLRENYVKNINNNI